MSDIEDDSPEQETVTPEQLERYMVELSLQPDDFRVIPGEGPFMKVKLQVLDNAGYQLALEQRKQLATKEWIIFREVKEGNPEEDRGAPHAQQISVEFSSPKRKTRSDKGKAKKKRLQRRSKEKENFHKRVCPICDKVFSKACNMLAHKRTHLGRRIPCDQPGCEKMFLSKRYKMQHVNSVHRKLRFVCQKCSKRYLSRAALFKHNKMHCGKTAKQALNAPNSKARKPLSPKLQKQPFRKCKNNPMIYLSKSSSEIED